MIFISHTSADREFVDHLSRDLSAWGFDLWYSSWEIRAGDSITHRVQEALRASDCLIVILSKKSCRARWVKQEVNAYLFEEISNRRGKIIPVTIEQCTPSFFLRDRLQIRFHDDGYDAALTKVVFELLQLSDHSGTDSIIDVFRRTKAPVKSIKQLVLRRQQALNDPRQVQADYVILNDRRLLEVKRNGDVFCKISLDILLCKQHWDCADWQDTLYDSREEITLEGVGYKTNSKITGHYYDPKLSSIVIEWEPGKKLRPGKVYRHTFEFLVEKGYEDPTDYWVHRRYGYPTLWTQAEFRCRDNIDRIIPCRPPYTFELIEPWEFVAYALLSRDRFPNLSATRNRVKIGLPSTEMADGLLVAFLFPGWHDYHSKDRESADKARKMAFEQAWRIESAFREEIGWQGLSTSPAAPEPKTECG